MDETPPAQPPDETPLAMGAGGRLRTPAAETGVPEPGLRGPGGEAMIGAQEATSRLRNMFAIVRSVFCRTVDTSETLQDLSHHFTGRFDALARLAGSTLSGRAVELEDIVRDELLTVQEGDGPHLDIAGPPVNLSFRQAPLIGLAIHELVTNSVKFGALATDGATLSVHWTLDGADDGTLQLTWAESGVPIVASAPMRVGFGRQYIEQALPYQLKARTSFELQPGGLQCRITLPDVATGAAAG